jgi:hypothetical protein
MRWLSVSLLALLLAGCSSAPAPQEPAKQTAPKPKPADLTRYFPQANLVESKVTPDPIHGKPYLPPGNIAHYKSGKLEYDLFLIKMTSPDAAAFQLLDCKKALKDAKMLPHFGGYFGLDGDLPVFAFSKGPHLLGVIGLPEKDADTIARDLAARVPAQ